MHRDASSDGPRGRRNWILLREATELFENWKCRDAEQRSLEVFRATRHSPDTYCRASALLIAGNSQQRLGQYRKSFRSFKQMLHLTQHPDKRETVRGWAYYGIGLALDGLGKYKQAISYHGKDLGIAERQGDKPAQGRAYANLGNAYEKMGEYKTAIYYHQRHFEIAEELQDKSGQGTAYCNFGCAYEKMGEYDKAIECLEKYLELAEQLDDKLAQGRAYCNLGCVYERMGRYKAAIDCHLKDLDIAEHLKDEPAKGTAYGNLGAAHAGLGQYTIAIKHLRKWVVIAKELDAKPLVMDAQERFGKVYLEMGDSKCAIDHFTQLRELAEELELEMPQCAAFSGLGSAYLDMGKRSDALRCHKEELRIAQKLDHKPSKARAYSGLGRTYLEKEIYPRAIKCHKRAMDICKHLECQPGLKRARGDLGDVYKRQGDYAKAIEHHQEYLTMAELLEDRPAQIQAQASLGVEHSRSGNPALAFQHFTKFGHLLSDLEEQLTEGQWRRHLAGFVENYADGMDAWVMAAAQEGDMLEALRVEEWRRCRSELPYLGEEGGDGGGASSLQEAAKSADAGFLIVLKAYKGTLIMWVLSGETGELVYGNVLEKEEDEHDISEYVANTTFTEWVDWQRALTRARREMEKVEEQGQPLGRTRLKELIDEMIPVGMKGGLDDDRWESIRDPRTFRETVFRENQNIIDLQDHYFGEAVFALDQLSKVLWEPILEECQPLKEYLKGDSRCAKSVSHMSICM